MCETVHGYKSSDPLLVCLTVYSRLRGGLINGVDLPSRLVLARRLHGNETVGLTESKGSLPPGLWLRSPAG